MKATEFSLKKGRTIMKDKNFIFIFFALLILGSQGLPIPSQQYKELENNIDSLLKPGDIVGFSACIIKNNEVVWSMVRGKADIENNIPVTPDTIFTLASLSKTVTGAALMQLFDKGSFALDDDINKYLPFKIRNPKFPDVPITFRMLLTHTSSLLDVRPYIKTLYGPGDQKAVSFGEIIKNCYKAKGKFYNADNFMKNKPGDGWMYCNSNYVLIAYLVELISKTPFPEYTKKYVFKPLEMNETGWFYADFDKARLAVQYEGDTPDIAKKQRVDPYGWPGYPDGCLKTTPYQYANFIKMLCNHGKYKGKQILKPETVSMILTPQNVKIPRFKIIPPTLDMGLTWIVTKDDSQQYFTHGGEGSGITTLAFFNPTTKTGAIMFLTGDYLKETGEFEKNPKRYTSLLFGLFAKYLN